MTATLSTGSNLYNGTVQFGQVTNTYGGYIKSVGSAYTLILPWQADKFEWFNFTKYGTDTNNLQGVWFRDFPANDALIINRGTTTLTSTLEATNGVTIVNTPSGFAAEQLTITGVTTATPAVVTTAANTLVSGQRVVITKLAGAVGQVLNNNTYVIQVLSSTTFALYDIYGVPVTVLGTYTSGGQATLTGPSLGIVDAPAVYALKLGTAVMGAMNDVIYFQATQMNAYFNMGTA